MAQTNKICKHCGERGHSIFYCKKRPRKPIMQTSAKCKSISTSSPKKQGVKSLRSAAKEKAWNTFSYYIRIRDSLATTGTIAYCICVTCAVRGDHSWKEFSRIQAGHGVGGRGNAVLFHEEIVNGQCEYCNTKAPAGLSGDYENYAKFFAVKYGKEHAEELKKLRFDSTVVYKLHDFVRIEFYYKNKVKELLEGR